MANWCDTNISIRSKDKKAMEQFYQKLQEWTSVNYIDNGFGLKWLGNVVGNSGIGKFDSNGNSTIPCRGSITSMYLSDSKQEIYISTDTAWNPMPEMWLRLIEIYLPNDVEFIYSAEEPGCEIFATNDPDLIGNYHIDSWDELEKYEEYCASEETVVGILQELLNTKESKLENLLDEFDESDFSECMSIHPWEYVPPKVWFECRV